VKDLFNSIRFQISERFSSPLFGAFILSWLTWNHKYLFVLFSSAPINERLILAKTVIFPTTCSLILKGLVYPIVSAVLFILIYPYPSLWLFTYWHKRQLKIKEAKDRIEALTPLTVEESNRLRMSLLRLQSEYEARFRQQADQIAVLKTVRSSSENELQTFQVVTPNSPPQSQIDDGVLKLISILTKSNGEIKEEDLFRLLDEPKVKSEYYIDQALALNLILRNYREGRVYGAVGDKMIQLTEAGRKFAVSSQMV